MGVGGGSTTGGNGSGGAGATTTGGVTAADCQMPVPTRAPLRRLTRFEYKNTVSDLKLDTTNLATQLAPEEIGNGFGNDADAQPVSPLSIKLYQQVAESIAAAVTAPARLSTFLPCAAQVAAAQEVTCAQTFVQDFAPKAYRRALEAGEAEAFIALFQAIRVESDFASSIAAIIEAVLQGPDFLYRPELGVPVAGRADLLRPTGAEMATRLSYLLWGTMPDDSLRAAAAAGTLNTIEGVRAQAATMLTDPRTKNQVRFFFDNLMPIASLSQLERDATKFPAYNAQIGSLMRQETQTFLEYQIFDGPGTWPSVFTADYTFVNAQLAAFYGMAGVTGDQFRQVPLDTTKRLGLLTQAGMVAGTIHSNETNPVVRGGFIVKKLLCQDIPLPTGAIADMVKIPDADPTRTARERFSAHSSVGACRGCHINMDPVGFALENFDPIGQWRDTEQGLTIDANGSSPLIGTFSGPTELAKRMAESPDAQQCFASNWVNFAYGRTVPPTGSDSCSVYSVQTKFKEAGYNVKELLLALTQSDAFVYLPAVRE